MSGSFDLVLEQLLRGGVAPGQARRYVAELRDHLADLVADEETRGLTGAQGRAVARLGSPDVLAAAMIERREFRSWSGRWPWLVYLAGPPIALLAGTVLTMVGVVALAKILTGPGLPVSDLPAWSKAIATSAVFAVNSGLAVGVGWAMAALAIRQRSAPLWPVIGLIVLAVLGAALQVKASLPTPLTHGEISLDAGVGTALGGFPVRLALNLALILLPYLAVTLWRGRRAGGGGAYA